MTSDQHDAELRFRAFYAAHLEALLAYALRRVEQPADAADVVADTFLVAWRRRDFLPPGDEARLWLYGVARKALANHHRGGRRRERLGMRLRERLAQLPARDPAAEGTDRAAVHAAMRRLSDTDRELLALSAWEGLSPTEIGEVLKLPATTVRTRLSRARARLRELLGNEPEVGGHEPAVRPLLLPEVNR